MILGSSGQNIYPEEIESKLNAMPYILESLILSRENKIHALIYLDYERIKEENLRMREHSSLQRKPTRNVFFIQLKMRRMSS